VVARVEVEGEVEGQEVGQEESALPAGPFQVQYLQAMIQG